jgi:hypothetical protein
MYSTAASSTPVGGFSGASGSIGAGVVEIAMREPRGSATGFSSQ